MFQMFSRSTFGLFVFSTCVFLSNTNLENSESLFKRIGVRKIVYPKVITRKETIVRFKRWSDESKHVDERSLYIVINKWTIKTDLNDDLFISPNYVSEWMNSAKENETTYNHDKRKLHKCLALKGTIKEVNNSKVLLTLCDNDIFGLINVSNKSYFLQPTNIDRRHLLYETTIPYKLTSMMNDSISDSEDWTGDNNYRESDINDIANNDEMKKFEDVNNENVKSKYHERDRRDSGKFDNPYMDYYPTERPYRETNDCSDSKRGKRALTICDTAEYYNMSGDLATIDYIEYVDVIYDSKFKSYDGGDTSIHDNESFQRVDNTHQYPNHSIRRLPLFRPPGRVEYRWTKIIVGVDFNVIQFHGRRTEQYVFTVFNIVSSLFRDISSIRLLRIVIMKMILYPDREYSAIYSGDAKYPLYGVNQWNRDLWHDAEEKHDMAVWYTHYHLTPDKSSAPGPYMCQWLWSCLLIEDVGWLSAVRIAHGIGHLMGLSHDGDLPNNNNCALEALTQTTIMGEILPAVMPNPVWSSCSKKEFELAFTKYSCLEKPPLNYEYTEFLYGVFSLDEQCRIEFGEGWVYCNRISVQDPCKELWCNKNVGTRRSCMTRQTRTLEGTLCGRGMRCINRTCEEARRPGYVETPPIQQSHFPGYTDHITISHPFDYLDSTTPSYYLETTTYRPLGYPTTTSNSLPGYLGTTIYSPHGSPAANTLGPSIYEGVNPHSPAGHPETSTHGPVSYPGANLQGSPGQPEVSTYVPASYVGENAQGSPGHPGATTYGPPSYQETNAQGSPGQPGATTYGPPSYQETNAQGSPGQPGASTYGPASYPEANAQESPGHSGATTYGPPSYPGANAQESPVHPEASTYGPSSYPAENGQGSPGQLEASTYVPPSYRGTNGLGSRGQPGATMYGPHSYPGGNALGSRGQPGASTYGPHSYPGANTQGTPGHPGATTYGPPSYRGTNALGARGQPGASTYGPPSYPGTNALGARGQPGASTYGPPSYSGTNALGARGQSGASTYGPHSYPGANTQGSPGHPGDTTYGPFSYRGTNALGARGQPGTSTYEPPRYPGANAQGSVSYPSISTYGPPGLSLGSKYSLPGYSGDSISAGQQTYAATSTYRSPGLLGNGGYGLPSYQSGSSPSQPGQRTFGFPKYPGPGKLSWLE